MNILTDQLPTSIKTVVGNIPIKTSYRDWILFEDKLQSDIDNVEKVKAMLSMVEVDGIKTKEELESILEAIRLFYLCGEEPKKESGKNKRVLSYEKDQFIIYADFMRYYNVSLSSKDMHWWLFKQMLLELPEEAQLKKVMMYRSITITSKMSKEQRKFYSKMKSHYALKQNKSLSGIGSILARGMKK